MYLPPSLSISPHLALNKTEVRKEKNSYKGIRKKAIKVNSEIRTHNKITITLISNSQDQHKVHNRRFTHEVEQSKASLSKFFNRYVKLVASVNTRKVGSSLQDLP